MSTALVIMAAGLASRYGGAKQIEKVGPAGEILMEYTIKDAKDAGFDRFIIVLQPAMKDDFREVCGKRLEKALDVRYAFQSFDSLPDWYTMPEGRQKPYGTVPAVLSAMDEVDGPFAVVNADDYYGPGAYKVMYDALKTLPELGTDIVVAYKLKNTVSASGTVTRGVCAVENGCMTHINETHEIELRGDGSIYSPEGGVLNPESPVSMNFWGFPKAAMGEMKEYFEAFLRSPKGSELKGECLLPVMVGEQIQAGAVKVTALTTDETWFGMTYKEDRLSTADMLKKLTDEGQYPEVLFPE